MAGLGQAGCVDGEPALEWRSGFAYVGGLGEGRRRNVRNDLVKHHALALLIGFDVENERLSIPTRSWLRWPGEHFAAGRVDVDAPEMLKTFRCVPPDHAKTKELAGGSLRMIFLFQCEASGAATETRVAASLTAVGSELAGLVGFLRRPISGESDGKRLKFGGRLHGIHRRRDGL